MVLRKVWISPGFIEVRLNITEDREIRNPAWNPARVTVLHPILSLIDWLVAVPIAPDAHR